jgi:hypothetical protein
MSDIGYTGQYEDDGATPMEDAMYRQKESRWIIWLGKIY